LQLTYRGLRASYSPRRTCLRARTFSCSLPHPGGWGARGPPCPARAAFPRRACSRARAAWVAGHTGAAAIGQPPLGAGGPPCPARPVLPRRACSRARAVWVTGHTGAAATSGQLPLASLLDSRARKSHPIEPAAVRFAVLGSPSPSFPLITHFFLNFSPKIGLLP
jgi:hypothetical protein